MVPLRLKTIWNNTTDTFSFSANLTGPCLRIDRVTNHQLGGCLVEGIVHEHQVRQPPNKLRVILSSQRRVAMFEEVDVQEAIKRSIQVEKKARDFYRLGATHMKDAQTKKTLSLCPRNPKDM